MATYKLTLKNLNNSGENSSVTLTYDAQGTAAKIKVDAKEVTCTLSEFNYSKEIYCPGKIWFRLQLGSTFDPSVIYKLFSSCTVQLSVGTFPVAENYRVFNIQLERKLKSSDVYVIVEAFSPDKFLTLDRYCKAYTGKKLVKEIIQNKEYWPDNVGSDLSQLVDVHPQFLEFAVTKTEETEDPNTHKKKTQQVTTRYEFIQPYLVQYNESFLDFLVRVTNRCGEFFYYEGGKIHIGWEATDPITIQEYVSVKFPQEISTAWADYAIADIHNDYTQGKNIINFAAPIVMRDSELAFDENLAKIPPKGEYTSWQDFALFPGCYFVNNISGALNSATITEMMEFYVFKSMASLINSKVLSIDTNNSYEKSNFDSSKPYFDERKNGDDLHPFSTNDTNKSVKSMTAYCLDFYTNIRNGIESAERSRLQIELGDHYCEASLGSLIQFEGDTQQYIVVKIESQIDSQTGKLGLSGGETLSMEVIPYTEGETVYPPSAHVEPMRSAKAQRAIITHNQDPLKMNRVRVRYPWQGKTESADDLKASEDSTPWIRIALPMASNGSGFNFLPEVGDEAIINYENGNIEKPYVEGMLYSSGQTVPFSHKRNNARVLSSVNGHCIIFSDPGASTNAIKGLIPAWNTICGFIPTAKAPLNDDVRKAMGGIELTDEYGLYSISMSSEKRSVTIDSPLGKVNLSAFTGITIEAPNGNVKIVGKNVDIVAGNNLTLTSGKNRDFFPKSATSAAVKVAENVIGNFTLIDFATIRTIMETFLRPIAGTLRLSSKRYLCIEAGKGATQILGRKAVQNFNLKKTLKENAIGKSIFGSYVIDRNAASTIYTSKIHEALDTIYQGLTNLFSEYRTMSVNILAVYEAYDNAYKDLHTLTVDLADYLTDTSFPDASTLFKKIQNDEAPQPVDMKADLPADAQPQTVITIRDTLQALNTSATRLHALRYVESEQLNAKLPNLIVVSDHTFTQLVHEMCTPVLPAELVGKDVTANAVSRLEIDKSKFRHAMYEALQYLVGHQTKEDGANYSDGISKSGIGKIASFDGSENWSKFVDDLSKESAVGSVAKDLVKAFVGIDKLDGMVDQYIWDTADHGKILISDEKGKTLHIDQGALNTYMESRQNEDDVDHVIDEIKQVLHRLD